ncbi:hypothetical protein NDU88_007424 [Pleurodeles waltl]|uniref:Uncharacterized protein n=1 Tax=Pleurodeles waltl TaxID=8319 RepID=A0AAV7TZQ5_PLEWA|nr:hypothetical protein NDU88_007424 [Pleurodeles waltl]
MDTAAGGKKGRRGGHGRSTDGHCRWCEEGRRRARMVYGWTPPQVGRREGEEGMDGLRMDTAAGWKKEGRGGHGWSTDGHRRRLEEGRKRRARMVYGWTPPQVGRRKEEGTDGLRMDTAAGGKKGGRGGHGWSTDGHRRRWEEGRERRARMVYRWTPPQVGRREGEEGTDGLQMDTAAGGKKGGRGGHGWSTDGHRRRWEEGRERRVWMVYGWTPPQVGRREGEEGTDGLRMDTATGGKKEGGGHGWSTDGHRRRLEEGRKRRARMVYGWTPPQVGRRKEEGTDGLRMDTAAGGKKGGRGGHGWSTDGHRHRWEEGRRRARMVYGWTPPQVGRREGEEGMDGLRMDTATGGKKGGRGGHGWSTDGHRHRWEEGRRRARMVYGWTPPQVGRREGEEGTDGLRERNILCYTPRGIVS